MFKVTIDVFSGRQNPSWILSFKEGEQLLDRINNGGVRIEEYNPNNPSFGVYNGFLVSKAFVPTRESKFYKQLQNLPDVFHVIGDKTLTSEEESWLLKTANGLISNDANLSKAIWYRVEFANQFNPPRNREEMSEVQKSSQCFLAYTQHDFGFWNDSWAHMWYNNCYNYAAGIRTGTIAQPGRASGQEVTPQFICDDVRDAAIMDGMRDNCNGTNFYVGLAVTLDGFDYHFWRKIDDNEWGHKPGHGSARNFDFSNNLINNPKQSDRGVYSIWCGYYYIPLWINIS